MIKNNFIIKTLCNFLCLFLGSIFVAACSSTSFENSINAYLTKDVEMQNKIENEILGDIAWNKTEETYLSDEDVWQVSYFFEI